MLHEQIKESIKDAMKAHDSVRLEVLRGLTTAFTNELVATKRTPQELLSDEEALAVITRAAKQRKDSIEQFAKGGRDDLVASEKAQLMVIEEYLPKMMDMAEVEEFVKERYDKLEEKDSSKKGMFMSSLMKELKGKADGAMVKEVVDGLYL